MASRLVKVSMEYEDGTVMTLEGDAARAWQTNLADCLIDAHIHGTSMTKHPWVTAIAKK